jgi:hypothetical protein
VVQAEAVLVVLVLQPQTQVPELLIQAEAVAVHQTTAQGEPSVLAEMVDQVL